jgi:hypothetical protein
MPEVKKKGGVETPPALGLTIVAIKRDPGLKRQSVGVVAVTEGFEPS